MSWTVNDIPDQTGKTAVVTGANTGIGYETAKALAMKGAKVVLACRNNSKAEDAVKRIREESADVDISIGQLDLSSLDSVRQFAEKFQSEHQQLDLLINNAGLMFPPHEQTAEGFELQFGTNHLGHFALTGLLFGQLSDNARVVSLSSVAHRIGKIDFSNLNAEKGYSKVKAYAQSKLACLMFAYELQRRLERAGSSIISVAAHPGATSTDLVRHSRVSRLAIPFTQSAAAGALPTLRAACDMDVKGGDYYGPKGFLNFRGAPVKEKSTQRSYNDQVSARLWEVSEQLSEVSYL